MNRQQISWRACINGMGHFISPYKGKLLVAVLATILATALYTMNPTIEGMATTQLANDASDILEGVSGAHVHFDKVFRVLAVLGRCMDCTSAVGLVLGGLAVLFGPQLLSIYSPDPDIVPFQKFCHDHFTGPGTVNLIIGEMFSDALFNHIDGLFAGIRKTGTETDHQNRFSCFRHKVLFLSSIVIISSVCSVPLLITFCQLSVEKTV